MDKESIKVSTAYEEMTEQHFNGGYFSDATKKIAEQFQSDEEKRAAFIPAFRGAYELAERLQDHPAFDKDTATIDLSNEGLGIVGVSVSYCSEEEAKEEGVHAFKGIEVATAFNPTPHRRSEWIDAPGDDLGLETMGPTMVTVDQAPDGWEEHIYANLDNTFPTEDHPRQINLELLRILDALETLELVRDTLNARAS